MTLYEISSEYMQLLAMLEDPDVDPEVVNDTLESVGGELADKCEAYTVIIKELEGELYKAIEEYNRWSKICGRLRDNIDRMKNAVINAISITGEKSIKTEHFKLSRVRNGGVQPMTIDGIVPPEYSRTKITHEVDKAKIREALETGEQLDFAHLEERGEYLSIK